MGQKTLYASLMVLLNAAKGWAYTVRVDGSTVAEKSAAIELTTSSMSMEIKAITELLVFLRDSHIRKAIVVTDSMSTLEKIKKKLLRIRPQPDKRLCFK